MNHDERDTGVGKIVEDMVGTGYELSAGSPLKNVDKIQVPVLLVHGTDNVNVTVEHSDKMNSALKGRSNQVEYLRYSGLDHQLPEPNARAEMLTKAAQLLERTIGK